jgi:acetate kinase
MQVTRQSVRTSALNIAYEQTGPDSCSPILLLHGFPYDAREYDPSLIPLLVRKEGMHVDEVMTLLNEQSGLLGVSGESLDTRVLMEHYDSNSRAKLAMDMFSYRVRKAVGAQLAVLGSADAVVFGGGIGESTTSVREYVCEGLRFSGLEIDAEANRSLIDIEGRLSTDTSKITVWVIPTEEALQIAHEMLPGVKDLEAGDTRGHWFWPGNHLVASKLRGFSRFQEGRLCRHRE